MCGAAPDAEDVVQDTLLAVTQHLGEFEGRSSLTSWVFAVARSACSRRRRGLKNQPPVEDSAALDHHKIDGSPERDAAEAELSRHVQEALAGLSEEHREVILLRDVEGLTAPEAAEALGMTVMALKSRLHRARSALRQALQPVLEGGAPLAEKGCPDVLSLWSKKLEGELSPQDCAAMEGHLLECPSCHGACQALRQSLSACRELAVVEIPDWMRQRILDALAEVKDNAQSSTPGDEPKETP